MKNQQQFVGWLVLGLLFGSVLSGIASWAVGGVAVCYRCARWGLAFVVGLAWAQVAMLWQLNGYFPVEQAPQLTWLEGEIIALPQITAYGAVRLTVAVRQAGWPVRRVQVRDYPTATRHLPLYQAGQHWRWQVRLRAPEGLHNFGLWRMRYWGWVQGVDAVAVVVRGQAQLQVQAPSMVGYWAALRAVLRARLLDGIAPDAAYRGAMVALAVGDQAAIPASQWALFNALGLTHLISISGSHVTAFGGWVGWLIYQVWRRIPRLANRYPAQQAAVWGALPWVWGYAALAGANLPAVRSALMFTAFALVWWWRRTWSAGQIWWGCLAIILLAEVTAVWRIGFWLSFVAVGALLLQGQLRGWRGWWRAQWVVSVVLLPWLLSSFGQIPWWSLLANLLAIPWIGGVVTPLALLGLAVPALAGWGAVLLAGLMNALEQLTAVARVWQFPPLPLWFLVGLLLVTVWLILPRGLVHKGLAWLALLPLLWWRAEPVPWGQLRVTVLDVGQGLSVLLETQHQRVLYDTGQAWASASATVPGLQALGVSGLDGLILSHADSDHAGGASLVRDAFRPRWQLASFPPKHPDWHTQPALRRCEAGQMWMVDGVRWQVLHPSAGAWPSGREADNAASCVVRVQAANGQALLLSGDLPQAEEAGLVAANDKALASDVLVVGHHGSRTSSSAAWLAASGAHTAVISVGRWNRYHHPHSSVLAALHAQKMTIWRTDCHGAVRFTLGNAVWTPPTVVLTPPTCAEPPS